MLNTIFKYAENYDINITFRRKGDKLVMILVPKLISKDKDIQKEIEKLPPLTITEAPQILEDNFEELISGALSKIDGISNSISEFDKAADKLKTKVEEKTGKKVEVVKKEEKKENSLFDTPKEVKKSEPVKAVEPETVEEDVEENSEDDDIQDGEEIENAELEQPVTNPVKEAPATQAVMNNDDEW